MDTDKGLLRRLPPAAVESEAEPLKLKERNVLVVSLDAQDRLECAGEPVTLDELHDRARRFIANPSDDPGLPEKVMTEVPYLGVVPVTEHHVIFLQISPCRMSWWRCMPNCATSSPAGSGNAPMTPSATGRSRPSAWSSRKRLLKPN